MTLTGNPIFDLFIILIQGLYVVGLVFSLLFFMVIGTTIVSAVLDIVLGIKIGDDGHRGRY